MEAGSSSYENEMHPETSRKRPKEDDYDDEHASKKFLDGNSQVVAHHYNKREEKGLAERNKSRIVYMRNFNNWIKSQLISEYLEKIKDNNFGRPLRVLDMCCGKGGDLLKWLKGKAFIFQQLSISYNKLPFQVISRIYM